MQGTSLLLYSVSADKAGSFDKAEVFEDVKSIPVPVFVLGGLAGASQLTAKVLRTVRVSGVLTPIRNFAPLVRTSTFLLSMLPAMSAANVPSPPCCQNVAIDTTEEVQPTNVGNDHSPMLLIACQSDLPATSSRGSAYGDAVPRYFF